MTSLKNTIVVVTGASAGIGQACAKAFAAAGARLILAARRRDRTENLASTLRNEFGTESLTIQLDVRDQSAVEKTFSSLPAAWQGIEVLVNNAGLGSGGRFARLPLETERGLLRLNIEALLVLTRLFLPPMVARGRGAILLVSSTAGFFPMPGSTTYAATKAFVTSFGQALWQECRGSGVLVTTVCPGLTRTRFHERAGLRRRIGRLRFASAETVARQALDGVEKGKRLVVPGTLNRIAAALSSWVPVRWILAAAAQVNGDPDPR